MRWPERSGKYEIIGESVCAARACSAASELVKDRATKEPVYGRRCRPGCRRMHEAGRHHWQDQPPLLQEFNNTRTLAPALITTQLPNWMKSPRLCDKCIQGQSKPEHRAGPERGSAHGLWALRGGRPGPHFRRLNKTAIFKQFHFKESYHEIFRNDHRRAQNHAGREPRLVHRKPSRRWWMKARPFYITCRRAPARRVFLR